MRVIIGLGCLLLSILSSVQHSNALTCTIATYNQSDINTVLKNCTDIIVNSIHVPAGVTLNLNLIQGAKLTFQGRSTWEFYEWSGPLLNVTGINLEITGTPDHILDVRGSLWWDGKGEHGGKIKPVFFVLHGINNSVFHKINVKNSPFHAMWIEDSDGVIARDVFVDNEDGDALGKSTDGFNVWKSNNVTFERITVYNQDDCIAIKSGTNILVTDTFCSGGHGLSIGSVGGRDYNIVENVLIENSEVIKSDNGVRIKTGYGVTGSVTNVTYKNIILRDINKFGVIAEGDYDIDTGSPTGVATDGVPITGFYLNNITGTVVETGVNIYVLVKNASDWQWTNVNVTGGKQKKECEGIPEGSGISCY